MGDLAPDPKRQAQPAGRSQNEPIVPVEEYYEHNTYEEALDALVGGLEMPMTWNYWQSCISKLAKHFKQESLKAPSGEARKLYNTKMEGKFGSEWMKKLPIRSYVQRQLPSGGQPTGGVPAPSAAAAASAGASGGNVARPLHAFCWATAARAP